MYFTTDAQCNGNPQARTGGITCPRPVIFLHLTKDAFYTILTILY